MPTRPGFKAARTRSLAIAVADGVLETNGRVIYVVMDMKVALSEG